MRLYRAGFIREQHHPMRSPDIWLLIHLYMTLSVRCNSYNSNQILISRYAYINVCLYV